MRRRAFLVTGAALAAASATPLRAQQVSPFARQLTLAVIVPLSGPLQAYGQQVVTGVQGAVDEANRYSLQSTFVFGMRSFDDQNSPAVGATNVQVAVADPSIVAILGSLRPDVILSMLPQCANTGFALLVPATSADVITKRGYRNVFRLPTSNRMEGQLFASSVLPKIKPSFALAVAQDSAYGREVARGFLAQATVDRHNTEVLPYAHGDDPAIVAQAIVQKKVDYVFLCGVPSVLGPLAPALRKAGYAGEFGAGDGFFAQPTIKQFGVALAGATIAAQLPPLGRAPSDAIALVDYQQNFGAMTALSAYGYAAAQIAISAAQRSVTTSRFTLLQQLQMMGSYNTMVGPMSFTFTGDQTDPNIYLYKISGKRFTFDRAAHPTSFVT
ncbi:MAG: ABC transporter substrate-binding protein [Vulcanimicrobiaceae bacterium]